MITPYGEKTDEPLPNRVFGDRPALISGLQRAVFPGNLGGYADPESEAGQADYLLNMIHQTEKIEGSRPLHYPDSVNTDFLHLPQILLNLFFIQGSTVPW